MKSLQRAAPAWLYFSPVNLHNGDVARMLLEDYTPVLLTQVKFMDKSG
jgi:hypothetical protein